jgi:hypothetical protein
MHKIMRKFLHTVDLSSQLKEFVFPPKIDFELQETVDITCVGREDIANRVGVSPESEGRVDAPIASDTTPAKPLDLSNSCNDTASQLYMYRSQLINY